jgi:multisubunit Na+/H+ antiporter MnhE subunit
LVLFLHLFKTYNNYAASVNLVIRKINKIQLFSTSFIIGSILSFSTLDPAPFETIVGHPWMWFQFWLLIPFKLLAATFTFLSNL